MYYAYTRNPLRNSKGQLVSLLHGYWGAILRIIKAHKPDYFAIVRDVSKQTFRHEIYPEYKANRKPMPAEMVEQMPYLNESLKKSGIPVLEHEGFEADDVMAAIAMHAVEKNCSVYLVTKDKDMAQLVNEKIHLYQIERGAKGIDFGIEQVKEKFGVYPEQMKDYLAIVGDSSDNIPGVAKIGQKGATELLKKYGTLENIYEHLAELPKTKREALETNRENAFLSKKLVALRSDYDFGYRLENLRYEGLNRRELYDFFTEYEVPSLITLLPNAEEPSLFSFLPPPKEEERVLVDCVEALQKMEEDLKHAKTLALLISENGAVSISKNEKRFYELSQDATLYKEWLKELFENENLDFVFYNAKATFHVLDFPLPKNFWDFLLAQWLLRPSTHYPNTLKNAAALFAKWQNVKEELERKNLFEFYESKSMRLTKCLYEMECTGISIDNTALNILDSELQKRILELEEEVFRIAESRFKLTSPKQLSHILYDKLKLPIVKKKANGPSTDAETLEMLLESPEPHPILQPILSWRELQKLQNGYTEALPKLVSPKTNRIHTTFLPWGTATGRLSSVNPNLQNIPVRSEEGRRIRAVFVPSQKHWKILSVDYSQIELRMLAHLSGDPELLRAFQQGLDIHCITAAKIFGTDEISKDMRAAAKIVNFGVIYGMSSFRLARDLRIARAKATDFISGYFSLYSKVKEYFEELINTAREQGFVETIAKRRRYLPELKASEHQERSMAERMAMNTPIQGSAADLIVEAMLRLHSKIKSEKLPLKMLLQVHDELVFECPEENAAEFSQIIKSEMENAMQLSVPIVANVGIGENWLAAK
jgi:DNA polymerase-1